MLYVCFLPSRRADSVRSNTRAGSNGLYRTSGDCSQRAQGPGARRDSQGHLGSQTVGVPPPTSAKRGHRDGPTRSKQSNAQLRDRNTRQNLANGSQTTLTGFPRPHNPPSSQTSAVSQNGLFMVIYTSSHPFFDPLFYGILR